VGIDNVGIDNVGKLDVPASCDREPYLKGSLFTHPTF